MSLLKLRKSNTLCNKLAFTYFNVHFVELLLYHFSYDCSTPIRSTKDYPDHEILSINVSICLMVRWYTAYPDIYKWP